MNIKTLKTADLRPANYNPRRDLKPDDVDYQKLRRSIQEFGYVEPIIWNKRTNRVVGGHQRLTILENEGETEVDVSVVDLDEMQERQLNIALNKVEGSWDDEKLSDLLSELGEEATFTGFNKQEVDRLTNDIESLLDTDTIKQELLNVDPLYNLSLTFDKNYEEKLKAYVKDFGKAPLVQAIVEKMKEES